MRIKKNKRARSAVVPAILFSTLATYPYQSEPSYRRMGRASAPRQTRLTYNNIRRPIISGRLVWYSRRLPRF